MKRETHIIPHVHHVKSGENVNIKLSANLDTMKCCLYNKSGISSHTYQRGEQASEETFCIIEKENEYILVPPTIEDEEFIFMYEAEREINYDDFPKSYSLSVLDSEEYNQCIDMYRALERYWKEAKKKHSYPENQEAIITMSPNMKKADASMIDIVYAADIDGDYAKLRCRLKDGYPAVAIINNWTELVEHMPWIHYPDKIGTTSSELYDIVIPDID